MALRTFFRERGILLPLKALQVLAAIELGMTMTVIRIKGLKRYRHPKTGIEYTYHRASGKRIKAAPGTPEFFAELAALNAKASLDPVPGTLGLVIAAYQKSPAWADLRSATRLSYQRAMTEMKNIEAMPLIDLDRPFVVGLQEKVFHRRGRWMANYVVTVLAILSDYGIDRGWMKANPADGVKRLKRDRDKPRANRPWTRAECRLVLDRAPAYLRVPIALAMFVGLRKTDVLTAKKQTVQQGMIRVETSKRGVTITLPIHPELARALTQAPAHTAETIAANSKGRSWSVSGFNSTFGKFIDKLRQAGDVEPGLTLHGLRHTLGTRLRESGADLDTIRRFLGQKTLVMAQHYSETADTSDSSREAMAKLDLTGPPKVPMLPPPNR